MNSYGKTGSNMERELALAKMIIKLHEQDKEIARLKQINSTLVYQACDRDAVYNSKGECVSLDEHL